MDNDEEAQQDTEDGGDEGQGSENYNYKELECKEESDGTDDDDDDFFEGLRTLQIRL